MGVRVMNAVDVDPVLEHRRIHTEIVEEPKEAVLQRELLLQDFPCVCQPLDNLGEMVANKAA